METRTRIKRFHKITTESLLRIRKRSIARVSIVGGCAIELTVMNAKCRDVWLLIGCRGIRFVERLSSNFWSFPFYFLRIKLSYVGKLSVIDVKCRDVWRSIGSEKDLPNQRTLFFDFQISFSLRVPRIQLSFIVELSVVNTVRDHRSTLRNTFHLSLILSSYLPRIKLLRVERLPVIDVKYYGARLSID